VDFYKHRHDWSNRLIAGDSLLVMNSLIEKEGMAGQVQMVFMDPPYGIKYKSNFQPFTNKRDISDTDRDEDLTQEPEMIKAFRDTWELGINSYLTYLRDRFLLARELLSETGSIFVQISEENLHLVRNLMDEVFGVKNFIAIIPFRKKTMPLGAKHLERMFDFIIWYGRDIDKLKYFQLFQDQDIQGDVHWGWIELSDGVRRRMTGEEIRNHSLLPQGAKIFRLVPLWPASYSATTVYPIEFKGKTYLPPKGLCWVTGPEGIQKLIKENRIEPEGEGNLRYVYFYADYNLKKLVSIWTDTTGARNQSYVVQTSEKVIERCIQMTTIPGDLVIDITCGSGTTASVAEQWGRRWITCDTSRVAITLAKQRLMTAAFDYYELAYPDEGVGSGFRYVTAPHITLKSIANSEPPALETLYDRPIPDAKRLRVTGPFTVEAVPAPMVKPLGEIKEEQAVDESLSRSGETLRQSEWRDELLKCGIRGKNNQYIHFSRVEPLAGTRWLHAEAETKPNNRGSDSVRERTTSFGKPERVVISFGPQHAPLEQRQVSMAIEEAQKLVPKPKIIVFASFQFDPEAAKDIDETDWPGVILLKVQMNTDLLTDDLKKKRSSNESFWLMGQPDVRLRKTTTKEFDALKPKPDPKIKFHVVEVHGFDYYNTKTGNIESGGTDKLAVWMLDTDYDGRSLFPRQVFFPMAGENEGWARLAKNLKAEIDEELIEAYRGTVSLPFEVGKHKRVAVKIVDDRGIESLKILEVE
jgi:adenine-specific DNA-methyltransferase